MGSYDGIESAETGLERRYFPPGFVGTVEVESLQTRTSWDKHDFFVAKMRVVTSNTPDLDPGATAAYVVKLHTNLPSEHFQRRMALGNVKKLIAALNGIGDGDARLAEITSAVLEKATSDKQPWRGKRADLSTSNMTTKRGTPFTIHSWSPVSNGQ